MSLDVTPLRKVLLVDDNPADRLLVTRELNRDFSDLEIYEVSTIEELKQTIGEITFDLVVTDYELNWATGIEVLHQVKAQDPLMPVVMFTDSGSQEIAVEAMKAGLDDYVLKSPRHLIRLSQAVRAAWENSRIRRRVDELDIRQRFLLNQLEVGVFRASLEGRLIEANASFLQLLDLTSLQEAQAFFQENFEFNAINRLRAGRHEWEQQLQLASGRNIWVQINEALVEQSNQTVIDGLMSDITEKKETAIALHQLNTELENRVQERTTQLEESNRQLQATNQELELLASSLSHDLQAPIRQINGFATLLREELAAIATSEKVQTYLHRIDTLTVQASQMILDLLDYSRTGRTAMEYTTVDMNRLVETVQHQVMTEQPERDITWQIDSLPTVEGDASLLKRVWQNLISNAVKYTRQRTPAVIQISSHTEDDRVIFAIADNGAGFNEQYRDRLFAPFKRLHDAGEFEGTGIGLASAKRIILRHGGHIWAESPDDQTGATFYFWLPRGDR